MIEKYKAVITEKNENLFLFYLKGDKAIEIQVFEKNKEYSVGDIINGEVFNKIENIDSSFINISKDKTGYLKGTSHKNGSIIPVMIKKLTTLDKQDIVTDELSIPGIYNVVFENKFILRTNSRFADEKSQVAEKEYLADILKGVIENSKTRAKGTILYKAKHEVLSSVFSIRFDMLDEIVTDSKEIFDLFNSFINEYKTKGIDINVSLSFYNDKQVSLFALYSLKKHINNALEKKVYLKSGAYLYIENTNALTVIDVNSGSTSFKGDKSLTLHKVNLEAAKEIVSQLRLRNLSGIIIVDFINTNNSEYDDELISTLNSLLKGDNRKAKCYGMTKLSLVEITRKRVNEPLYEQIKGIDLNV